MLVAVGVEERNDIPLRLEGLVEGGSAESGRPMVVVEGIVNVCVVVVAVVDAGVVGL